MPAPRLLAALNLTAVLALVGVLELAYHRTAARLMLPNGAFGAEGNRFMMALGSYLGHLAGILGLFVVLNALLSRENRRLLFPRPIQISLIFIASVFFFLATRGIVSQLGQRNLLHLQISHAFLVFFFFVGLWYRVDGNHPPLRTRFAAALFTLPPLMHATAVFLDRVGGIASPALVISLDRMGEIMALSAALLAPLLLAHRSARGLRKALAPAAAVIVLASTGSALLWRFDLLQTLTMHGLGFELPIPLTLSAKLFGAFFVCALGGAAYATIMLLSTAGADRMMGLGIILVVSAGYQAATPAALILSLAGLFALALGAKRTGQATSEISEVADAPDAPEISGVSAQTPAP